MTVNTTNVTSGPYAGNGVTATFDYDFRIDDESQLLVYETSSSGNVTELVLGTDYTVSGVGVDAGGSVTRVAGALPSGYTWYMRSNRSPIQNIAFDSQGGFFPSVHEGAIDHLTFLIQQLLERMGRVARLPDSYSGSVDPALPTPAAQTYLRWNADLSGLENAVPTFATYEVLVETFGAIGDGSDETQEIQQAINSFTSPLGGVVRLDPTKRYRVTSLTIPDNVILMGTYGIVDQDEGANYGYDSFWGAALFVSGTITLSGHGSALRGVGVLASHLDGYSIPTTDAEANALVAAFTGTAIDLTGTGTLVENTIILGFEYAITDNGNRHRIKGVRFDCTNGISLGGGSDVSRIEDCHGWPYLTTELSLSSSVNYRSGYAYKFEDNADKYSMRDLYEYGYEIGYYFLGSAGNIVQSCAAFNLHADSGKIGGSGTSVGFLVGNYVADLDIYEAGVQNYDINVQVDTQGADTGGGERLNKVKFHGGKLLEASSKFAHIINGYVGFSGVSFQKGSTSTVCIDWDALDGGYITNCDFEEMYTTSGAGKVIDFASDAVRRAVRLIGNNQGSVHEDNRFDDNSVPSLRTNGGAVVVERAAGTLTIATGAITVSGSRHNVDTEASAATDDLDTINGGEDGMTLYLRALSSSRTVVLKDGTGNLHLSGDITLDSAQDIVVLMYDSSLSGWVLVSFSNNSA